MVVCAKRSEKEKLKRKKNEKITFFMTAFINKLSYEWKMWKTSYLRTKLMRIIFVI